MIKLYGASIEKCKIVFNESRYSRLPARIKARVIKEDLRGIKSLVSYTGFNLYLRRAKDNIILSSSITGK